MGAWPGLLCGRGELACGDSPQSKKGAQSESFQMPGLVATTNRQYLVVQGKGTPSPRSEAAAGEGRAAYRVVGASATLFLAEGECVKPQHLVVQT